MPRIAKVSPPSQLVLESFRKIARDTTLQAVYVFLLPEPIEGTVTHRSFSFNTRREHFSAAAEQFIKTKI
jgi:hypothetical protein